MCEHRTNAITCIFIPNRAREEYNRGTDSFITPDKHMVAVERMRGSMTPRLEQALTVPERMQYPNLLSINTRVLVTERGKPLSAFSDEELKKMAAGYDTIWFMGIFKESRAGRESALRYTDQYRGALPDLDPEKDVASSPYAICSYTPDHRIAASWAEWDDRVLGRLNAMGVRVVLDFVSNHTAKDHPWVSEHPDWYVTAPVSRTETIHPLEYDHNVISSPNWTEERVIMHGKEGPWSRGWSDTYQLNFGNPELHDAHARELVALAGHANGLRCDMADLLNPGTFLRNWKWLLTPEQTEYARTHSFWDRVVPQLHAMWGNTGLLIAESYNEADMARLSESGFDSMYDKVGLYDLLREARRTGRVNELVLPHLRKIQTSNVYGKLPTEFEENHDEPRAVSNEGFAGIEPSKAAAVISAMTPSMHMIHLGQIDGRTVHIPMQVRRLPTQEPTYPHLRGFYARLNRLRQTALFQEGEHTIVESGQVDPHMVVQHMYHPESGVGAYVCTHFSEGRVGNAILQIPSGCRVAGVYDLTKGKWLETFDNPDNKDFFVGLPDWDAQVIFYEKT